MTDEQQPRKKVGRPPKDPSGGVRPTLTFRCRRPLHERLQATSREADRSVSEEIERRVESSYAHEDNAEQTVKTISGLASEFLFRHMYADVGGQNNFGFGLRFANAVNNITRQSDEIFASHKPWYQDIRKRKFVEDEIQKLVPIVLDMLAEELDPEILKKRLNRNLPSTTAPGGLSSLASTYGMQTDPLPDGTD